MTAQIYSTSQKATWEPVSKLQHLQVCLLSFALTTSCRDAAGNPFAYFPPILPRRLPTGTACFATPPCSTHSSLFTACSFTSRSWGRKWHSIAGPRGTIQEKKFCQFYFPHNAFSPSANNAGIKLALLSRGAKHSESKSGRFPIGAGSRVWDVSECGEGLEKPLVGGPVPGLGFPPSPPP